MRAGQRLISVLWRWHRRTGVVILLFVLLLTATGILLNHTTELDLDSRFVNSEFVLGLYGDNSAALPAYPLDGQWLSRTVSGQVYLDSMAVASCSGDLVGAASTAQLLVLACAEELLLLTPGGELVESIHTGLPIPLLALGMVEGDVVLMTEQGWRLADFDALVFEQAPPAGAAVQQIAPGQLPADIRSGIPGAEQWLTWERLLLDLHSGRILGFAGVLLMDLMGVLLACVAVSGLTMWLFHRGRRRARSKGR